MSESNEELAMRVTVNVQRAIRQCTVHYEFIAQALKDGNWQEIAEHAEAIEGCARGLRSVALVAVAAEKGKPLF